MTSLAHSVCQTVQTLLGDPLPQLTDLSCPCRRYVSLSVKHYCLCVLQNCGGLLLSFSALESLQCVRSVHRQYWSCLKHAGRISTPPCSLPTGQAECRQIGDRIWLVTPGAAKSANLLHRSVGCSSLLINSLYCNFLTIAHT